MNRSLRNFTLRILPPRPLNGYEWPWAEKLSGFFLHHIAWLDHDRITYKVDGRTACSTYLLVFGKNVFSKSCLVCLVL